MPATTTKSISACVDQTHTMPARSHYASQHVLTKHYHAPCQQAHNMHINLCSLNPTHASELSKCISTWVEKNPSMPARPQVAFQHALTKTIPVHRGHKIHLFMWWAKSSCTNDHTKFISTFPCQQGQKFHRNICRPNPSDASYDTKCISTRFYQAHPMSARTEMLTKSTSTCVDKAP